MNILLVNQFFWPDAAATSQLLTDLARHLAGRGHTVRVICGSSPYAPGDRSDPPPVAILRSLDLPFQRTALGRLLSYASFLCSAAWRGIRCPKQDLVVTLTTPPVLSLIGSLLKRLRGSRHYIWEMDVYPDVAVDLNVWRAGSWSARTLGAILDRVRRNADGIIVLGPCMRDRLLKHGLPESLLYTVENWVDSREVHPLPFRQSGRLTILYSGNLGLAHDVATTREVMHRLRTDNRFHFVFAGGGPLRGPLEDFCRRNGLSNVSFRPYCSRQELCETLSEADLGLVTQKEESLGAVVPSKIYGLMAAGRPILFIGPGSATPALLLARHRCGWHFDCGNADGVVRFLQSLPSQPEAIREAGARANSAFLQHYDLPIAIARMCEVLGISERDSRQADRLGA